MIQSIFNFLYDSIAAIGYLTALNGFLISWNLHQTIIYSNKVKTPFTPLIQDKRDGQ